jgi:tryptophanyl-tRNA synthetase
MDRDAAIRQYAGRNFSDFKRDLADLSAEVLGRIGGEMRRLLADPGYIDGILSRGRDRAQAIAGPVLAEVFEIMGLLRPIATLELTKRFPQTELYEDIS